jgi:hypothetical protein
MNLLKYHQLFHSNLTSSEDDEQQQKTYEEMIFVAQFINDLKFKRVTKNRYGKNQEKKCGSISNRTKWLKFLGECLKIFNVNVFYFDITFILFLNFDFTG